MQQICRIYGVPPEMIGADSGNSMTYANVEQRDLALLKYVVGPWLTRLETALTALLPAGQYVKFNTGGLLRTDLASRYASYAIALTNGFLTVDEVRALEDREPLPPEQTETATAGRCRMIEQRSYIGGLEVRDDGRTIIGRAVPYREMALIGAYAEQFVPGAFADVDPATVPLTATHPRQGDTLPIGITVELHEEADGLHGMWRVSATPSSATTCSPSCATRPSPACQHRVRARRGQVEP